MKGDRPGPCAWVQALAYGGLVPFGALALLAWLPAIAPDPSAASALLAYAATIVSFLGAIHWGLAMRDQAGPEPGRLVWGVIPSLMAWVALLLPVTYGLALLAAILWACFAVDRAVYPRFGLQAWLPMRLLLSVLASLACIVAAFGEQACSRFSGC